jgi:hypothetical protein
MSLKIFRGGYVLLLPPLSFPAYRTVGARETPRPRLSCVSPYSEGRPSHASTTTPDAVPDRAEPSIPLLPRTEAAGSRYASVRVATVTRWSLSASVAQVSLFPPVCDPPEPPWQGAVDYSRGGWCRRFVLPFGGKDTLITVYEVIETVG